MKILLTDDHQLFADGLGLVLDSLEGDVECLNAANGHEALEVVSHHPDIDVALIDLSMPDMNGIELMRAIRARGHSTPMVLLSSTDDIYSIRAALNAGAVGFIPKSFGREELQTALREILSGNVYLPASTRRALHQLNEAGTADGSQGLTERQLSVLGLLARGHANKKIAQILFISENTVKFHVRALLKAMAQIIARNAYLLQNRRDYCPVQKFTRA